MPVSTECAALLSFRYPSLIRIYNCLHTIGVLSVLKRIVIEVKVTQLKVQKTQHVLVCRSFLGENCV